MGVELLMVYCDDDIFVVQIVVEISGFQFFCIGCEVYGYLVCYDGQWFVLGYLQLVEMGYFGVVGQVKCCGYCWWGGFYCLVEYVGVWFLVRCLEVVIKICEVYGVVYLGGGYLGVDVVLVDDEFMLGQGFKSLLCGGM